MTLEKPAGEWEPLRLTAAYTFPQRFAGAAGPLRVDVALPFSYNRSDKRYPVAYVTDGNIHMPFLSTMRPLSPLDDRPEVILVGIGYDFDMRNSMELAAYASWRRIDMVPDGVVASGGTAEVGAASAFCHIIEDVIRPLVEANFRIDSTNRTYIGASLGGLLGLHFIFNRPGFFRRYIIGSPTLYWGGRILFRAEAEYAAKQSDLNARIFLFVGENEETDEHLMVSDCGTFVRQLEGRGYPNCRIVFDILPGETHVSCSTVGFARGLKTVFQARS